MEWTSFQSSLKPRLQSWHSFLTSGTNLRNGWLITAGIVALYVGAIRPHEFTGGINNSKAAGLAQVDKAKLFGGLRNMQESPTLGGRVREVKMAGFLSAAASPAVQPQEAVDDRKMVRTAVLDLIVQSPADSAEKIGALAVQLGGFLVSSQVDGGPLASSASLTVRVPVSRFEEARAGIRRLGLRVESERIDAQDVTRQYVDQDAGLRNLRAEETQYLAILKQARTVKDTLDTSEKLGEVRGQIEQQQAEFEALSKQIETAAITVSLRAEAEARVLGLNWRPLYQVKLAFRDGLEGLANYATTMTAFVFLLPTVVLWMVTILIVCAVAWKVLRWVGRRVFTAKVATTGQA
jgi:Domain of unknown function (DUF4349)